MPLERSEDCFILFPSFCPRLDHPSTAEEKQNVNSEAKQDLGFSYTGCSLMAVQPCFVISMAATKRDCNVGVCLIRFCSPSFLDYVTYVTMRYVSSCSIALVEFTAMDNYRGLCMGVLWKVCLPQASFCRRYVVSRYPNLGSGRNYSEQRMSGMSQYSVRSNTGLLVWILAFYIFWLSVLNGDQFIFQQFIMVSHPEGLRIREENVCVNAVKLSLEIEPPCSKSASPAAWVLRSFFCLKFLFGFLDSGMFEYIYIMQRCNFYCNAIIKVNSFDRRECFFFRSLFPLKFKLPFNVGFQPSIQIFLQASFSWQLQLQICNLCLTHSPVQTCGSISDALSVLWPMEPLLMKWYSQSPMEVL